jgi:hypothetical protein
MFTNPVRLANILIVVAALALCVSACTGFSLPHVGLTSYNLPAAKNLAGLLLNASGV